MEKVSSQNVGCLGFLFRMFGSQEDHLPDRLPYRIRDDFLSRAELSFYGVLRLAVGNRWVICPKVSMGDIFFAVGSNRQETTSWRNRIASKHVDFLLCDPQTMRPMLAIELDDQSHERKDRQQRDSLQDQVFRSAGLPLVRIRARAQYSVEEIASALQHAVARSPHKTEVPSPRPANQPKPAPKRGAPPLCPKCGTPMVVRQSRQDGSRFYGCPNYPRCRQTAPLTE